MAAQQTDGVTPATAVAASTIYDKENLMNFRLLIGVAGIAATSVALADNHAANEPEWSMGNPVEIYGCSFKDGINGYQQSIKHAALVNAWAEEHDAFQNHVGQLMWPDFSDGQYATDFTWLGYWGKLC
jgi:hypothetical protein